MVASGKNIYIILSCCLALASVSGCSVKEDFTAKPLREMIWPLPPNPPKIKLTGVVSSPLDIGITENVFETLWNKFTGEPPERIISPFCIEADQNGRIYVVDTTLKSIHVFDQAAKKYHLFNTSESPFAMPIDIAVDNVSGYIYVTDSEQAVVQIYKDQGKTYVGELGRDVFERPTGIAINPVTSELLVVDTLKGTIFRHNLQNGQMNGNIGSKGELKEQFNFPTHIFVNSKGNVFVTDTMNFRVSVFSSTGLFLYSFGQIGDSIGYLSRPRGIAQDSDGNIYVVDALQDNVQIFNESGEVLLAFGNKGTDHGQFWLPAGIAIDHRNNIYVADSYNHRIQIFQYLPSSDQKEHSEALQ